MVIGQTCSLHKRCCDCVWISAQCLLVFARRLLWCTRWFRCGTKSLGDESCQNLPYMNLQNLHKVLLLQWEFFEQVLREPPPPSNHKRRTLEELSGSCTENPPPHHHKRRTLETLVDLWESYTENPPYHNGRTLETLEDLNPGHARAETMLNTWVSRLV